MIKDEKEYFLILSLYIYVIKRETEDFLFLYKVLLALWRQKLLCMDYTKNPSRVLAPFSLVNTAISPRSTNMLLPASGHFYSQ